MRKEKETGRFKQTRWWAEPVKIKSSKNRSVQYPIFSNFVTILSHAIWQCNQLQYIRSSKQGHSTSWPTCTAALENWRRKSYAHMGNMRRRKDSVCEQRRKDEKISRKNSTVAGPWRWRRNIRLSTTLGNTGTQWPSQQWDKGSSHSVRKPTGKVAPKTWGKLWILRQLTSGF